jgi:hypothetical protein
LAHAIAASPCPYALHRRFAEEARQSPALEQAIKIEAAIKFCKLFSAIPRPTPKFDEIAARGTAIYGKAAPELNVPVPEASKLSESRAAVLIEVAEDRSG